MRGRERERARARVVLNRSNVVERSSVAFFDRIASSMIAQCIHTHTIYLDTFFRLVAGTAAVAAGREANIVAGRLQYFNSHGSFRSSIPHSIFQKFSHSCFRPCAPVNFTNKFCMFYFTPSFCQIFGGKRRMFFVVFFFTHNFALSFTIFSVEETSFERTLSVRLVHIFHNLVFFFLVFRILFYYFTRNIFATLYNSSGFWLNIDDCYY